MPNVTQTRHIFGRDISYRLVLLAEEQEYDPYSITSARLYANSPTDAQRADHTAALGGMAATAVTSWTNEGNGERLITFAALTDATPHSSDEYTRYFVVVSYLAQAAGPTLISEEAIFVWRPAGITSRIRVEVGDIYEMEEKIQDLKSDSWVIPKIETAKRDIFRKLKSNDYEKRRLFNIDEINDACVRRALFYCCSDLAGDDTQFWMEKAKFYNVEFEEIWKSLTVGYDAEADGDPVPTERANFRTVWVQR